MKLHVPSPDDPLEGLPARSEKAKGKGKEPQEQEEGLPDDGELGGEVAGRLVWENFETELKEWEKANPPPIKNEDRTSTPPEVDTPSTHGT